MLNRLIIVLLLAICFSCTDFLNTWDAWEIDKGEHHSTRTGTPTRIFPSLMDGRHVRFDAYFTTACLYDTTGMGVDAQDINKLYGFTDCNSTVHQNSARFGWRHKGNGTIEIFAYWYSDGQVGFQYMGATTANHSDEYDIWAKGDSYYFKFNNTEYYAPRTKNCSHGVRVRCFPWFGGNRQAPNSMTIFIYEYE